MSSIRKTRTSVAMGKSSPPPPIDPDRDPDKRLEPSWKRNNRSTFNSPNTELQGENQNILIESPVETESRASYPRNPISTQSKGSKSTKSKAKSHRTQDSKSKSHKSTRSVNSVPDRITFPSSNESRSSRTKESKNKQTHGNMKPESPATRPTEQTQQNLAEPPAYFSFHENPFKGNVNLGAQFSAIGSSPSSEGITIEPPDSMDSFGAWLTKHFPPLVQNFPQNTNVPDIESFLIQVLKSTSPIPLRRNSQFLPVDWWTQLGSNQYNIWKTFLREFTIVLQWLEKYYYTSSHGKQQLHLSSYFTLREHATMFLPEYPSASSFESPPPYETVSSTFRPKQPHKPQPVTSSYIPTSPEPVDSMGDQYTYLGKGESNSQKFNPYGSYGDEESENGESHHSFTNQSYYSTSSKSSKSSKHSSTSKTIPNSWSSTPTRRTRRSRGGSSGGSSKHEAGKIAHFRYEAPYKPRQAFGQKYVWDGTISTFDTYQSLLEGFLTQVGAWYLVQPDFLRKYKEERAGYFVTDEFYNTYGVSLKQADYDKRYLYGILVSTNRKRKETSIMNHQNSQDGIICWIEMKERYGYEGCKEIKIERLEGEIQRPFKPGTPGGIRKYLDEFQVAMVELDALEPLSKIPDPKKKRLLISNLRKVANIAHLTQKCKDDDSMSFMDTVRYLLHNVRTIDALTKVSPPKERPPPSSSMLTAVSETSPHESQEQDEDSDDSSSPKLDMTKTIALVKDMASETSYEQTYNALTSRSLREQLMIPHEIWKRLEPKLQQKILDIRREVTKDLSNSSTAKPEGESSKPTTMPSQYPTVNRANAMTAVLDKTASLDSDSDEDDVDDDWIARQFKVTTMSDEDEDIVVKAHFEYAEAYKGDPKVYAISDGGADSFVLGKYAHVINETGRYATLVGYDPQNTRSTKVPIVSAYLKVKTNVGVPVFLKANEATYKADNPITLLSEYQIREYGMVIDSVAIKHKKSATEFGTQRFELSSLLHIPFEDRGGIMGFEILPITKDDFDDNGQPLYEVFTISGEKKWTPRKFTKESTKISTAQTTISHPSQDPSSPKIGRAHV